MNIKEWIFGSSQKETAQKHELLRHRLYQSIQEEKDRHNRENEKLIERYRKLYENFRNDEASDDAFREALDCLCSYYYEWCRHSDVCTELERKYDADFNEIVYQSLPLPYKLAQLMQKMGERK